MEKWTDILFSQNICQNNFSQLELCALSYRPELSVPVTDRVQIPTKDQKSQNAKKNINVKYVNVKCCATVSIHSYHIKFQIEMSRYKILQTEYTKS